MMRQRQSIIRPQVPQLREISGENVPDWSPHGLSRTGSGMSSARSSRLRVPCCRAPSKHGAGDMLPHLRAQGAQRLGDGPGAAVDHINAGAGGVRLRPANGAQAAHHPVESGPICPRYGPHPLVRPTTATWFACCRWPSAISRMETATKPAPCACHGMLPVVFVIKGR